VLNTLFHQVALTVEISRVVLLWMRRRPSNRLLERVIVQVDDGGSCGRCLPRWREGCSVPWRHKRREMMAIAVLIPVAKWLAKIKQRSDVSCRLCKRAREQRGASTENLPEETYGHINSAFCDGMATTITAAHHFIWKYLYASIQAAQTPVSSGLSHLIKRVV